MRLDEEGRLPFDDDAEAIAAHLRDLNAPALLMALVRLTGDVGLIDGPFRPTATYLFDDTGGLPPDTLDELRAAAAEAIVAHRERGYTLPPAPDHDDALAMAQAMVAEPIGEEYRDWIFDELHLDAVDPGRVEMTSSPDERAALPVVVIGCGESGIVAGVRMQEAGIPFTIVDKNDGPGGTWLENRYPGCRVDIPNHFYSYSFDVNDEWTGFFSEAPELLAYLQDVHARHGLDRHVRWRTEVTSAEWQDGSGVWHVHVRTADGDEEVLVARAVISAVGQLNRPMWPDLPGADSFAGPTCHTAQWDDAIDLAGKRVAVIGAGASGFQLVPAIADEAGHVDVYQRTAQWMAPSPRYHEKVGPGVGWAMRHLPSYARWYRLFLAWHVSDGARGGSTADPDWAGDPRSVSELNDISRQIFTAWLEQQVDDPDLLEKVIPDYPTFGKRLLQDNGTWLRTLQRDDVELIRDTIDHIVPDGVTTVDGVHRRADILVWATGFRVSEVLWPMRIVGSDGRSIDEVWDGKPAAYLGITVPGFPNFFVMYGPGTNMVHGGSVINMSECQITYIMGCLDRLAAGPTRTMEVRPEVGADYQRRFHDEMSRTVWEHPAVRSYYKHADGRVYTVLPFRSIDYWTWTRAPKDDDFVIADAAGTATVDAGEPLEAAGR